ncbi:bifunctional riboflavin kinase/FAD synthetase [Fusobacterium perfoetens]|uniref:bifunctional riboflavin kinase/FAD synthetase n=1 Tax=Fusobacterium perfoetens TaxID=852 RepID=UPI000486C39A|nr:bifunctional riboflavin kinase/FAD synthetase [Fusobacterium perfoetens]MCI6153430.1 bifunctional riboflavin kinase/FAD synthetase [Fusobacterium perfoetens]MDY3238427.1 bifunctional riboflavin kinase/FAD synthetase [Fusobacterium perfoetens]
MKIIIDIQNTKERLKNSYIALGTFDGIHRGHRVLINGAIEKARKNNGISVVYTFLNHPLEIVAPERVPKMINTIDEKLRLLEEMGVDYVVLQTFDKEYAKTTKEEFIDKFLIEYLGAKEIFVGFNYTFAEKGSGNVEYLREVASKKGIILNEIPAIEYKGKVLSSTLIRKLILDGKVEEANMYLGRPFFISGVVEHGKKLGRVLGFPTANLKIVNKVYPPFGIFGGTVSIEGENKKYNAVINIGRNPTLKPGELSVEVHILDFDREIYGRKIDVSIEKHLRDEKKFNSMEELRQGIKNDVENWRKFSNRK